MISAETVDRAMSDYENEIKRLRTENERLERNAMTGDDPDTQLRMDCLKMAVAAEHGGSSTEIVQAAEAFYRFAIDLIQQKQRLDQPKDKAEAKDKNA